MRTIQRTISFDRIDPRPLVFRAGENDVRVHFKTERAFDAISIDGVSDTDGVPESGGFYIDIPSTMTNADGRYMMVISYDSTTLIYPFWVSVERTNLPPWIKLTNLVTNGDFSNGTTGWGANTSTLSVSGNTLFVTATGAQRLGNLWGEISAQIPVGRRFYQRAMISVDSALCTEIRIFNGASSVKIYDTPPADTWIPVSTIQTTNGALLYNYWYHYYDTPAIATGKVMSVKYALLIDLTDLEAALGRAVTVEEMNTYMSQFDNDWFDGSTVW